MTKLRKQFMRATQKWKRRCHFEGAM